MIIAASLLGHFFQMFTESFPLAYLAESCRSVRRSLVSARADINGVMYERPASKAGVVPNPGNRILSGYGRRKSETLCRGGPAGEVDDEDEVADALFCGWRYRS
jgi:hypothetical protein